MSEERSQQFERLRPYLLRVAYTHLGAVGEAEDVVQEAWLRLERADEAEIRDLRAWLTKTVSRIAVDALTSARARRETYVGTWLPEPLLDPVDGHPDTADRVTLDETVSIALLVVLESLTPAERCAFLLHDVFGYSFAEVAEVVGRTPQATRQLASRARRAIESRRPHHPASATEQRQVIRAFLTAAANGDIAGLLQVLDPEVQYRSDGGGLLPASRRTIAGAARVARMLARMDAHYAGSFTARLAEVNGSTGLLIEQDDELTIVAFTIDAGQIREINMVRNPAKLRHMRPAR